MLNKTFSPYLLIILSIFVLFASFRFFNISFQWLPVITAGCLLFAISFFKTDFALIILIFSMLLSPEFKIGGIVGRDIVVRLDDIFLFIIFFGWMSKIAVNKQMGLLKSTPLNLPIIGYILICAVSTMIGILRNYVSFKVSIFYFLKYLEYFMIFFMVANNIRDMKQVKIFVFSLIFVCFVISVYACILHFLGSLRVTAPFEGEGEANTLGAYLILLLMLIAGILLNSPSIKSRIFLLLVLMAGIPAFLFTLSRGSWLAFLPSFAALFFLTKRGKSILLVLAVAVILLSPIIIPKYVYKRVSSTFVHGKEYNILGRTVELEESAAARIDIWRYSLKKLKEEPLLGYGVGSPNPIIDNQYARLIVEVGLIGFLIFSWLMVSIYRTAIISYIVLKNNRFVNGLVAGFIAGFIGLLVHAISAETFILIRVMEPFWFLAAIVATLPGLALQKDDDLMPVEAG